VFGEAVGIGVMLTQAEHGVVLQQPIQNIEGFAGRTGNHSRAEDRILIGGVRVQRNSPFIVAEVARIKRGKQRTLLNPEPLAI